MNGELFKIADAAAFVSAIDQELADAAKDFVDLQRKGRVTQPEVDYVIGLLRDIRSDLCHAFGPLEPFTSCERADPAVRWRAKVQWVSRELSRRRVDYPELVAKGRILERDAKQKLRMLETLFRLYWRELFMWEPDPGPALDFLLACRQRKSATSAEIDRAIPHGRQVYRELVRKHLTAVELEDDAAQGRLVA